MKEARVVLKGKPNELEAYLKISVRRFNPKQNKITTQIHSLDKKVKKRDFNPKTQRMRLNSPDYESINLLIEERLKYYQYIPYQKSVLTIRSFINKVIETTHINGTKERYTTILHKFEKYLESLGKTDMFFDELNQDVVESFYSFMRNDNSNNTTIYKMKCFKALINKADKRKIYKYVDSPFSAFDHRLTERLDKEYLTSEELKKIINHEIQEYRGRNKRLGKIGGVKYNLQEVRNMYVFSIFSQGIRISDALTLKWKDFHFDDEEKKMFITKIMVKTRKPVVIYMTSIIIKFIQENPDLSVPQSFSAKKTHYQTSYNAHR